MSDSSGSGGGGMQGLGLPSSQQLWNNASVNAQRPINDNAFDLANRELKYEQRYAPPASFPNMETTFAGDGTNPGLPEGYNAYSAGPYKLNVPTAAKDRLAARNAVAKGYIGSLGESDAPDVIRTLPITDEEVSYVQTVADQQELADFERWFATKVNLRKASDLKYTLGIYPEFIDKRISQQKGEIDLITRGKMIDMFGCNTMDDLVFLYMRDQGKIVSPEIGRRNDIGNAYVPGYFSLFDARYKSQRMEGDGIRLPFASATIGQRMGEGAGERDKWTLRDTDPDTGAGFPAGAANMRYERNPSGLARSLLVRQEGSDSQEAYNAGPYGDNGEGRGEYYRRYERYGGGDMQSKAGTNQYGRKAP